MLSKLTDKLRYRLAMVIFAGALGVMIKYLYDASQCDGVAVMGVVWVECVEKGDA